MAILSKNNMNCHLYIKGTCIILIEYFYYYIPSRTADSEKCGERYKHKVLHIILQFRGELFLTECFQEKQNMHKVCPKR